MGDEVDTYPHPHSVDGEHEEDNREAHNATDLGPSGQAAAEPHVGDTTHTTAEYGECHYQTSILKKGGREGGREAGGAGGEGGGGGRGRGEGWTGRGSIHHYFIL